SSNMPSGYRACKMACGDSASEVLMRSLPTLTKQIPPTHSAHTDNLSIRFSSCSRKMVAAWLLISASVMASPAQHLPAIHQSQQNAAIAGLTLLLVLALGAFDFHSHLAITRLR